MTTPPVTVRHIALTNYGNTLPPFAMHKALMAGLDAPEVTGDSPRADTCLLHHRDGTVMTVQCDHDITVWDQIGRTVSTHPLTVPDPGTSVRIEIDIARYTIPSVHVDDPTAAVLAAAGLTGHRAKVRPEPVPVDQLTDWATTKLTRTGLDPTDLTAVVLNDLVLDQTNHTNPRDNVRSNRRVPVARITATVTADDTLSNLLVSGIGKAKNYGLGMVRIIA